MMEHATVRCKPSNNDEAGYSLLELLVVLSIVALASLLVVPQVARPQKGVELRALVASLAAHLRSARASAIGTEAPTAVVFDLERRDFRLAFSTAAPVRWTPETSVSLTTARPDRRDMKEQTVQFFPDGSSSGGSISFSADGRMERVSVDWLTGAVRIESGPQ